MEGVSVVANIEGLDELEEALLSGAPRTAKKFLRTVHMKAGAILKESASANAPYHSGELDSSIHQQNIVTKDGMTSRIGPSKSAFWGAIQEFGAPKGNVTAQHWLEQAAVEVQDQVLDVYVQAIDDGLKAMKGGK